MTPIDVKYTQLGGASGFLGIAISVEQPAANGGKKRAFQNGSIYWHAQTGAFEVHGAIRERWLNLGGEGSFMGYPTSDESAAQDALGRFNSFQNAAIYWHPTSGAYEVHGRIRERWLAMGGERSTLGYPVSNETATPDGIGRFNHFQRGSMYWTPKTDAQPVYEPFRSRWAALRWERGLLGYPSNFPYEEIRNRVTYLIAPFQNGSIEFNKHTKRVVVKKLATEVSPNYIVPVVAYRVADDDGTRACAITAGGVQQWVDEANLVFSSAGIRFSYDGVLRDLNDTQVNNVTGEDYPHWTAVKQKLNQLALQHRSIVLAHRAEIGGGFSWSTYDFVAMSFFDSVNQNALSILAHELGHHLGLPHTHGKMFTTVGDAQDFVLSGGNTQEFDGDSTVINDTPADPYIEELNSALSVNAVTLGGRAFSLARANIMSYWHHVGMAELSHSQIDRVRVEVRERAKRYLNVTTLSPIDCAAQLALINEKQIRLNELIANRNDETDIFRRIRLTGAISRLRVELYFLKAKAIQDNCLRNSPYSGWNI